MRNATLRLGTTHYRDAARRAGPSAAGASRRFALTARLGPRHAWHYVTGGELTRYGTRVPSSEVPTASVIY